MKTHFFDIEDLKTIHINGIAYRPATLQEVAKGLAIWTGNLFVVRVNS